MSIYRERKACFRDLRNKKLAGVCAGIAHRFDIPIWLTRVLTVLLFLKFPLMVAMAYGISYAALPSKS
ncbi:PspC domain-containing protein [Pseudoalteromonas sp. JBTF-M23]|uniref:PspC domain-containing protein n=1 Tax=Pseudoalteromonas caenipelagi TaxID=2726988 RepID=A0A849VGX8_9GAMM|nr:PspC domain-containing protein [Pseudoalteromonas caenipelagi]NOU51753.1 PspC domain-containing protein [Pseudoalteromonas caenipelagi]